jgi:aspartyl-tRNA(Asn)/glutamyl-tRNA(Gln) amidotransferase subunit C
MDVTKHTIDQLAKLARLNLAEGEKDELVNDLGRILQFVDQLKEEDTKNVEPLIFLNPEGTCREDKSISTISREEALLNAPEKNSEFFKVPKVIK